MKLWIRLGLFAVPWIISFVLLWFDLIDGETAGIINVGGMLAATMINVILWQTKPKKIINQAP